MQTLQYWNTCVTLCLVTVRIVTSCTTQCYAHHVEIGGLDTAQGSGHGAKYCLHTHFAEMMFAASEWAKLQ